MTGGVALNCVANAKILEQTDVRRLWVPPCASDTGAPLGSALWHYHQDSRPPARLRAEARALRQGLQRRRDRQGPRRRPAWATGACPRTQLLPRVAQDLADGKIVGWFQGRFEMGPRALGNRSILADPRRARHARRPQRQGQEARAVPPVCARRAGRARARVLRDRPARPVHDAGAARARRRSRDRIPAAVHVDGTGRIQTVERSANPRYYGLIEEFGRLTGVPVLLNTSFNRTEPIVASPTDAVGCYLRTRHGRAGARRLLHHRPRPGIGGASRRACPAGAGTRRPRRGCTLGRASRRARPPSRAPRRCIR